MNTIKRIRRRLAQAIMASVATLALALGLLTLAPAPAQATIQGCSDIDTSTGTDDCIEQVVPESQSEATATTTVTDVAANGVDIHSKVHVVAYVQAHGATKAQMKGDKIRLKHAGTYNTSYINIYGQEVWHMKSYPAGYVFVKGSDGYWHDPKCWNKVVGLPQGNNHAGALIRGKIKIVKKFHFKAVAVAKVKDHVKAHAMAWANATGCHAEASANAEASFFAKARAVVRGSVLVEVLANVKERANGNMSIKLGGRTLVNIHADVVSQASGSATAKATAQASCTSTPPSVPAPKLLSIRTINDILVNNSRPADVTYTVAPGHSAELYCTARNGGTVTSGALQSLTGNGATSITVKAPSEVPGALLDKDHNVIVAAGHDRVDCVLTQDDGQFAEISTNEYAIIMPIPDPPKK